MSMLENHTIPQSESVWVIELCSKGSKLCSRGWINQIGPGHNLFDWTDSILKTHEYKNENHCFSLKVKHIGYWNFQKLRPVINLEKTQYLRNIQMIVTFQSVRLNSRQSKSDSGYVANCNYHSFLTFVNEMESISQQVDARRSRVCLICQWTYHTK